jgi:hypothetical protein
LKTRFYIFFRKIPEIIKNINYRLLKKPVLDLCGRLIRNGEVEVQGGAHGGIFHEALHEIPEAYVRLLRLSTEGTLWEYQSIFRVTNITAARTRNRQMEPIRSA